jgi:hypothetical protein
MSQHETVAGTPADPTIQFVPLTLGKKTYQLCYDFDAVAKAEDMTGLPLLAGVDWRNISIRRIAAMLYASALKADPDVTLAEFKPLIKHGSIGKIQIALAQAWVENQGDEEESTASQSEDSTENPPVPDATTGAN